MTLLWNMNSNVFKGTECEKEIKKVKNLRVYDLPYAFKSKF